jgi:hypothetical protein
MRAAVMILVMAWPLAGCAGFAQGLYDERAEQECEQIVDIDARRACLSALADEQLTRDQALGVKAIAPAEARDSE